MLTKKQLQGEVYYDRNTGYFFRIKPKGKNVNCPCGSVDRFGYISVSIKGRNYPAHKLVILYCYGFMPLKVVDHLDGNRTNNKASNLRACSHSTNSRNATLRKDNKTGVSGAYELPYGFSLVIGGVSLGTYKDIRDLKVVADEYRKNNGYGDNHGVKRGLSIFDMISAYKVDVKKYRDGEKSYPENLNKVRGFRS